MANAISYAAKYSGELDKMIVQESKTGFLADNAFKAMFTGARTVKLPELTLEGLGDYDRAKGYASGDVTLEYKEYTLSKERSKQLILDAQDSDESGVADLAGKLVGEFTRTQVVPELDAYNISKLYGVAADTADGKKANIKTFTEGGAVSDMLASINAVEAANGYRSEQIVALVDPVMYAALMTSTELQRQLTVSDFKQGEANFKVKNLNGCAIIPVSSERMFTTVTFDANTPGFKTEGSGIVRAIVMPKTAASFIKKVDKVNMFTPDQVEDMDAYKINFRLYYDLFVKTSHINTIHAIYSANA